jgi:nucleotide-binding universal stress UspA family protein
MSFKTVLVHCADERRVGRLLGPSVALARRLGAHLTALSVLPPVLVDPALTPGGVATVIDSHRKAYAEDQARMKSDFDKSVRAAGISAEWIEDDAERGSVWRKVVDYGRSADLIVASQADTGWAYSHLVEAPADLVLQSGRPVLFIPNAGDHVDLGRRVLVAWNGRREAARAAHDAMPLLETAQEVDVLWINPGADKGSQDLPGADLCTALARHGVKCEAAAIDRPGAPVGETLLARARHTHRDLVVMGCYGHSRFREFILGGATREVLSGMEVPVLMSH